MTVSFIWVDLETTGIKANRDVPLELGLRLTDTDGNEISRFTSLVSVPGWDYHMEEALDLVKEMHTESGLIADLKNKSDEMGAHNFHTEFSLWSIDTAVCAWLESNNVLAKEFPITGSSVHFDREFIRGYFPLLFNFFTHRIVDISVVKELCKKLNPAVYAKLPDKQPGVHRVQVDIDNSIQEFRFYRDNFLWVAADV